MQVKKQLINFLNGALLKGYMNAKGFTNEDLAKATGISTYTISALVTDCYKPTLIICRKIARALNLTDKEIIDIFFSPFLGLDIIEVLEKEKEFLKTRKPKGSA